MDKRNNFFPSKKIQKTQSGTKTLKNRIFVDKNFFFRLKKQAEQRTFCGRGGKDGVGVCLRDVVVLVRIVLVALHVVAVDEGLDPLLEIRRLDRKLELVEKFGEEEVVRQRLPHLHDPDDGRVDLVLTVLEDPLLRRLLLFRRFLQLHLVDLDVEQLK